MHQGRHRILEANFWDQMSVLSLQRFRKRVWVESALVLCTCTGSTRWLNLDAPHIRYARVDRRPLDPPPVVSMRMYSATGPQGMLVSPEYAVSSSCKFCFLLARHRDVLTLGLVCTVDLFPVPPISEALVPFQSPALTTEPSAPFHYVDGQPIYEHTKVTSAIVGSTIVQPNTIDWKNELQLMFVFSVR